MLLQNKFKREKTPKRLESGSRRSRKSFGARLVRDMKQHICKYIVVLPVLVWLILFCYKPMYGVVIAFQNFNARKGIAGSEWVGLHHFKRFFNDPFCWRVIRNTLSISGLSILFSFPVPIILALMLNEIRVSWFKRTIQTVTYMPHFISTVVVCSLLHTLFGANGLIPEALKALGGTGRSFLLQQEYIEKLLPTPESRRAEATSYARSKGDYYSTSYWDRPFPASIRSCMRPPAWTVPAD